MGSFKENTSNDKQLNESKAPYSGDISDIFDQYLSKKLAENDLISFWLIQDLYHHYYSALKKSKREIV